LQGDARWSGSGIDLVPHKHDDVGAAWVSTGFVMEPDDSFVAEFTVWLDPGWSTSSGGIAFVVQAAGPFALGSSGDGLGYAGIAPSVAVELDVQQGYYDADANHVAVDLDGSVTSAVAAPVAFSLLGGAGVQARVEYQYGMLSVWLDPYQPPTGYPTLTVPVALPAGTLWVGFTGASDGDPRRIDAFTFSADGTTDWTTPPTTTTDPTYGTTGTDGTEWTGGTTGTDAEPVDTGAPPAEDPDPAVPADQLPPAFFCGTSAGEPGPIAGIALLLAATRRASGRARRRR
jgi:hypothetical protein